MIADSIAFLVARGQARAARRRALLRRLSRTTPATRSTACARPPTPAPSASCSATPTAARCPRRSPRVVARRARGAAGRRARHPHARRLRLRGRQHARRGRGRRDAGPGHDQRDRRAHRQREPRHDHRRPAAEAGHRGARAGAARAPDRDRALRRRAAEPRAGPGAAVRRQARLRAQGRACTPPASAPTRSTFEHIDPEQVGNRRDVLVSELAGRGTVEEKAAAAGIDLGEDGAARVVERVKELEHLGYQFEAADASFELLMRARGRHLRAAVPARVLAHDRRAARRRQGRVRGDGQGLDRRRALRAHGRGQRPGQRARRRAALGDQPGPPAPGGHRARQLQGPDPRRDARHAGDDARADRLLRRDRTSGARSASRRT